MTSTLSDERAARLRARRQARTRPWGSNRLDEIAVFALVAAAIFYIAAASCWFIL